MPSKSIVLGGSKNKSSIQYWYCVWGQGAAVCEIPLGGGPQTMRTFGVCKEPGNQQSELNRPSENFERRWPGADASGQRRTGPYIKLYRSTVLIRTTIKNVLFISSEAMRIYLLNLKLSGNLATLEGTILQFLQTQNITVRYANHIDLSKPLSATGKLFLIWARKGCLVSLLQPFLPINKLSYAQNGAWIVNLKENRTLQSFTNKSKWHKIQ